MDAVTILCRETFSFLDYYVLDTDKNVRLYFILPWSAWKSIALYCFVWTHFKIPKFSWQQNFFSKSNLAAIIAILYCRDYHYEDWPSSCVSLVLTEHKPSLRDRILSPGLVNTLHIEWQNGVSSPCHCWTLLVWLTISWVIMETKNCYEMYQTKILFLSKLKCHDQTTPGLCLWIAMVFTNLMKVKVPCWKAY